MLHHYYNYPTPSAPPLEQYDAQMKNTSLFDNIVNINTNNQNTIYQRPPIIHPNSLGKIQIQTPIILTNQPIIRPIRISEDNHHKIMKSKKSTNCFPCCIL